MRQTRPASTHAGVYPPVLRAISCCPALCCAEFEEYGATKADVLVDKMTQRSRGFGFVFFKRYASACVCAGQRLPHQVLQDEEETLVQAQLVFVMYCHQCLLVATLLSEPCLPPAQHTLTNLSCTLNPPLHYHTNTQHTAVLAWRTPSRASTGPWCATRRSASGRPFRKRTSHQVAASVTSGRQGEEEEATGAATGGCSIRGACRTTAQHGVLKITAAVLHQRRVVGVASPCTKFQHTQCPSSHLPVPLCLSPCLFTHSQG